MVSGYEGYYMQEAKGQLHGHIHSEMFQEYYYIKVLDLAKGEYVYIFYFFLHMLGGPHWAIKHQEKLNSGDSGLYHKQSLGGDPKVLKLFVHPFFLEIRNINM